jgi:hypothetical protein
MKHYRRKVYILVMRLRGRHVMAKDCWCHPEVTVIAPRNCRCSPVETLQRLHDFGADGIGGTK